eukprot:TRINITY_DN10294_c0_g2_i4.p1 TRINITY_DN10294_c0_g2~~TRINITY_DN10294_c0_g2_i4.p1  ORF type:complete len:682 (-),score=77.25 TRINITY_DN10294_c0_g2_i4:778-2823(-)
MLLVISFGITACILLTVLLVTTSTTVRHRNVGKEPSQSNGQDEQEDQSLSNKNNKPKHNYTIFRIKVSIIVTVILLIPLIVFYSRQHILNYISPPFPPFECEPLSTEERINFFQNFQTNVPFSNFASDGVEKLFRQGYGLCVDFNRVEAQSAFKLAVELDPACIECYWGLAYAKGPFLNYVGGENSEYFKVFSEQARQEALQSTLKARKLVDSQTDSRVKMYVEALVQRYDQNVGWQQSEVEFGHNMIKIHEQFPDDYHSLVIAADAIMTSTAWNYYDKDRALKPELQLAYNHLQKVIKLDPHNIHALHLLIHLTEQYMRFEGEKYADALGSIPNLPYTHLIHMPTHTYIRIGRYHDALIRNEKAYYEELKWAKRCVASYVPEHNLLAGIFGASMAGQFNKAEEFALIAKQLPSTMPSTYQAPGVNWPTYPLLMIRYAKWKKLAEFLDFDQPNEYSRGATHINGKQYASIVELYATIMYYAAVTDVWINYGQTAKHVTPEQHELIEDNKKSGREIVIAKLDKLRESQQLQPDDPQSRPGEGVGIYMGAYKNLSAIYVEIAEARIAVIDRDFDSAINHLKRGVEIEDAMGYMEPPRLYQPVRQCLGWVLEKAGRYEEAKKVYEEDLEEYPLNGWSLKGLIAASQKLGLPVEELEEKFAVAWQFASEKLQSSCPAFSKQFENQ